MSTNNLRVPSLKTRSPALFRRPHSKSNPKTYEEVNRAKSRKRSKTVHFGYGSPQYEDLKAAEIQRKFPADDLHLSKSLDTHLHLLERSLTNRRRSSAAQVIVKLHEKLSKSSTNISSDSSPRFIKSPSGEELSPTVSRNFIRDGPVCLSCGVTSLNRYMFLFNDLLLIAKPKSGASFKLKLRLPVSELWLHNSVDGVSESNIAVNKSFVIGWPTVSYVATFSSPEDKSLWWNVLKKTIDEQRGIDCGKTIPIRIQYRDSTQNSAPLSLPVSNEDDVKSVVKMALQANELEGTDADAFQLWVVSGKENAAYPLMGHEIPFCIKMNHMRQTSVSLDSPVLDRREFAEERISPRSKCEFILKKKKTSTSRLGVESPNSQKRWRSPMKSPIINWALHKKPQKQNSIEQLSPQGNFFGLPLNHFSPDDEQLPTPVEDMLLELFRRGPSTDGIFRKSALMKTVKQLKQELEEGKIVSFKDKSAVVIATIFKEFLRGLPSCAFGSEFLQGILETNDIDDHAERVAEINKNLNKLPKLNQILIKKFLCVLYHIARLSETNQMTSQNLAICIAPSLVWSSKAIVPSCAKETTAACEFVMFMIDNYIAIFGEEATTILGDESEIQPPITYEDEDMLDQNSDTADTALKTLEEVRAKKADFTLSLRVPDFNITPDVSPTSPEIDRKCNTAPRVPNGSRYYDLKITNRRHSENDLTDLNDNLPVRKLRAKVPLTSYTATAELIKHQENGQDDSDDSSSTVIRIVSSTKETPQVTNGRRKISPSNHAIYHRKVRPTPTYEEAIRQLRRNAQFSPLFSRKSDDYLESSDDSIDLKSDDKPVDALQQQKNTQLSNLKNNPISPTLNRFSKTVKPERQKFTYNIGSPTTDRLKTSRYAVEDLRRRSPEQTPSGNSRHPSSPAYEQHLQRRRRFEAAYLQKINLDLNDIERPNGASKSSEYKTRDIDFARSYNGAECEKLTSPSSKGLATSLDSSTLRALRAQAVSGSQNVVPLSNGVHTFITHRRNTNEHIESKVPTSECLPRHSTVSSTVSATPRLMTSYWKEHDRKQTSPLRAAIDVGSFMYRPGETSANGHFTFTDVPQVNGDGHKKQENGIAVMKNESNNNNSTKSNLDRNRAKKSDEKAVEDFDKLISTLKSRTDSSSTNSSESAGNLDVPSHEHIKTILCQDESYV